jgi:hypothetical protein
MFYCSENRPTSYIELLNNRDGNVGDEITLTISCWQLAESIDVVLVLTHQKGEVMNIIECTRLGMIVLSSKHKKN